MVWTPGTVGIPFLFCLAPLAAQDWRVWGAVLVIGAVLLGWGWGEVWPAGPGSPAIGASPPASFVALCTAAFGLGASWRAVGLALQRRGLGRAGVLWTDLLGLALTGALMLALWLN